MLPQVQRLLPRVHGLHGPACGGYGAVWHCLAVQCGTKVTTLARGNKIQVTGNYNGRGKYPVPVPGMSCRVQTSLNIDMILTSGFF